MIGFSFVFPLAKHSGLSLVTSYWGQEPQAWVVGWYHHLTKNYFISIAEVSFFSRFTDWATGIFSIDNSSREINMLFQIKAENNAYEALTEIHSFSKYCTIVCLAEIRHEIGWMANTRYLLVPLGWYPSHLFCWGSAFIGEIICVGSVPVQLLLSENSHICPFASSYYITLWSPPAEAGRSERTHAGWPGDS